MEATQRLIEFTQKHLSRLDRNLIGVRRDGDADAVHDFRVASRRLQEPLAVIEASTSSKKPKQLRQRLQRLRRTLNRVRDLDVLHASFDEVSTESPLDDATRTRLDRLLAKWRSRQLSRACDVLADLNPERVRTQVRKLVDTLRDEQGSDAKVADQAWSIWRKRVRALRAEHPGEDPACDLHACRVLLKKARYSTELLRWMQRRERGALVEAMMDVQDMLGAWNDQLFAAAELGRIAAKRKLAAQHADFCAALYAHAASRARLAHTLRTNAVAAWSKLTSAIDAECKPHNGSHSIRIATSDDVA